MKEKALSAILANTRSLYVINTAGIIEHYENFTNDTVDPNLFSALFSSVHIYASQIGAGHLEIIVLETHKFVFKAIEANLIVLDVNLDMTRDEGLWLVKKIVERFDEIQELIEKDTTGVYLLPTLFGDFGKSISWDTIKAINEHVIEEKSKVEGKIKIKNLSQISISSASWAKHRNLCKIILESQFNLDATLLFIRKGKKVNMLLTYRTKEADLKPVISHYKEKFMDYLKNLVKKRNENVVIETYQTIAYRIKTYNGGLAVIVKRGSPISLLHINKLKRLVNSLERISKR